MEKVKVAIANSCLFKDLFSTSSLDNSQLVSEVYNIEDVVIEASNKKLPRSSGAKGSSSKDAPREKHLGLAKEVSPIKTISSHLSKESETSGAVSDKAHVTCNPPFGQKSQRPSKRLEYLVPYINEFSKLIKKKISKMSRVVHLGIWLALFNSMHSSLAPWPLTLR